MFTLLSTSAQLEIDINDHPTMTTVTYQTVHSQKVSFKYNLLLTTAPV